MDDKNTNKKTLKLINDDFEYIIESCSETTFSPIEYTPSPLPSNYKLPRPILKRRTNQ